MIIKVTIYFKDQNTPHQYLNIKNKPFLTIGLEEKFLIIRRNINYVIDDRFNDIENIEEENKSLRIKIANLESIISNVINNKIDCDTCFHSGNGNGGHQHQSGDHCRKRGVGGEAV